jgi:hypothetical protein
LLSSYVLGAALCGGRAAGAKTGEHFASWPWVLVREKSNKQMKIELFSVLNKYLERQ